jgi:hypothetical protein
MNGDKETFIIIATLDVAGLSGVFIFSSGLKKGFKLGK